MMGPLVIPYGGFPVDAQGNRIWSDSLQAHLEARYVHAQPILNQLGEYAVGKNVKLAIEPITHWETPAPNTLAQLLKFLEGVPCPQVGVVLDSAHETLDGAGPELFAQQVQQLAAANRLHYVQASPPDRGALHTSWIPWVPLFTPILQVYNGPIAVEIFNAIPPFRDSLRLSRRKFWIPGLDTPNEYPSAYDIAAAALNVTQTELTKIQPNP
jgi:sugar phosphate isomerase/epimerase